VGSLFVRCQCLPGTLTLKRPTHAILRPDLFAGGLALTACAETALTDSPQPITDGRVATSGVTLLHPDIQGIGDLSVALRGWSFPVARITVQCVKSR
jgi:hypothetical protein